MKVTVIKIGGNVIDEKDKLHAFLKSFASIEGPRILVHGGGKIATGIGEKLGIKSEYVNGRRITDRETLDLVTMVYGGLVNKSIVAYLQSLNCNAIGLTGADGNAIPAVRREVKEIDYGFVGDVTNQSVNAALFTNFLQAGLVPVVAPLTHDLMGSMLNTNADTIAQELARALAATMDVQLVYCFEKRGVLRNADDDNSVIDTITDKDFEELKAQQVVSGGMVPKLENALAAVASGVKRVVIGQAEELPALCSGKSGTSIV